MKLAINTDFGYPELSRRQRLEFIKAAGFDAVFPLWNDGEDLTPFAADAKELGLEIQSIHAPFRRVEQMWDPKYCEEELAVQFRCMDAAQAIGVSLLVCHVWKGFGDEVPNETGIKSFRCLLDEAHQRGLKIALENTEGEPFLKALMDALWDHPAVGFCWDSGHEQCYNRGKDMLALCGSKLLGTHLNDNLGVTGEEITWHDDAHILPLTGIINWEDACKRLAPLNFGEYLTFELTTKNKPDRHTHDGYAQWSCAEFLARAHFAATFINKRIEALRK